MALHDYQCPVCGHIKRDVNVPISVGAQKGAPLCPHRCQRYEHLGPYWVYMEWIPQVGRIDALESFQEFTVEGPRGEPIRIDSLRKLRQVERLSEQGERNGEGTKMVWRDYSQDASNKDRHALTNQTPDQMADPRGAQPSIRSALRKGKLAPACGEPVTSVHGTVEGA